MMTTLKRDSFNYFISTIRGESVSAQNEITPFDTFHGAWCELNRIREEDDNSDLTQLQIIETFNDRCTKSFRFV